MKKLLFIACIALTACATSPWDKHEFTEYKGAEVLDKDTIFEYMTLKMPNGEHVFSGYYPKDAHYKPTDTIK